MTLREEVIKVIKLLESNGEKQVTAQQVANELKVSRNGVSHHMNRLVEEKILHKSNGRPVQYSSQGSSNKSRQFSLIGRGGSLKSAIDKSTAALNYPAKDLTILFTGKSGVGKSYLANFVVQECKQQQFIDKDAPFFILNCADYANNPELLSGNLFGYQRGAFTGANEENEGLLKKANGGILFIDEVHRLSAENQEKLFLFMDTGTFSPLGDSSKVFESNVKLIFATTEDVDNTLLTTFKRRISLKIRIPSFNQRPIFERMSLVLSFFKEEENLLNKEIIVSTSIIDYFVNANLEGNIGETRSIIKIICADIYTKNFGKEKLIISSEEFPNYSLNTLDKSTNVMQPINKIDVNQLLTFEGFPTIREQSIEVLKKRIEHYLQDMESYFNDYMVEAAINRFRELCWKQLGIDIPVNEYTGLNKFWAQIVYNHDIVFSKETFQFIQSKLSKSFYFANKIYQELSFDQLDYPKKDMLSLFSLLFYINGVKEEHIPAILLAHGESTARSIGNLTNQLLKEPIFEAIDVEVTSGNHEIIESIKEFLNTVYTKSGLIFIVDMGSLEQLYSPLKKFIFGELLLINYLSTPLALDIGLKIQQGHSVENIVSLVENKHEITLQSYEGFSKSKNIIVSCISGLGVAKKIKEIIGPFLPEIDIVTMDYQKLLNYLQYEIQYFANTLCVISTNTIDTSEVTIISTEELLSGNKKVNLLYSILGASDYQLLTNELNIFFSIEGIGMNLSILNPEVVIGEMVKIVEVLENYFDITFQAYLKRNLLNHLSLMIERNVLGNYVSEVKSEYPEEEKNFFLFAKKKFAEIEEKYNIVLSKTELSLIYQIIISTL